MGASVITVKLDAASWVKAKPDDYKGKELETALKKYESVSSKGIPTMKGTPKGIAEFQQCIKDLQSALDVLKPMHAALQDVAAACDKTIGDLSKQTKGKSDDDQAKYKQAQNIVQDISSRASKALNEIK
jgi:hypothetical protein